MLSVIDAMRELAPTTPSVTQLHCNTPLPTPGPRNLVSGIDINQKEIKMNNNSNTPTLAVDNDKTLLIEVASEFEAIENQIMREEITNGTDTPRMTELKERKSATLKRVLCKLVEKPGKPWAQSRGKLKLLD